MDEADLKERNPVRVMAGDVAVLLVKIGDTINAISNTCTHLGGPLNEGQLEGDSIRCPWHGSRFCLADGSVLEGPATFPEREFDVRVRAGRIEVRARQS
jgi:nitrite reductase/ring-hydroxylating ferredoxin subunit